MGHEKICFCQFLWLNVVKKNFQFASEVKTTLAYDESIDYYTSSLVSKEGTRALKQPAKRRIVSELSHLFIVLTNHSARPPKTKCQQKSECVQ